MIPLITGKIMEIELWQYVTVFFLVGFAGLIDSIAGGGGLITVPTYLAMGLPAELILGTNKCVSSAGTTFAVFRYIKNRTIVWQTVVYAIGAALVGSTLGASLSAYLSRSLIFTLLLVVIPVLFYLQANHMTPAAAKPDLSRAQIALRPPWPGFLSAAMTASSAPGPGPFCCWPLWFFCTWEPAKPAPMRALSTMPQTFQRSSIF